MPINQKTFVGGKLNQDVDYHALPSNDWVDALNVRVNSTDGNYLGAITNIKGTTSIAYTLPEGDNIAIGARGFDNVGKIFYFIWNELEDHRLLSYSKATGTVSVVAQGSVLGLSSDRLVNHIDLLDEKYLFWVDGSSPKMIDLTKSYGTLTAKDLSVIKAPPLLPPANVRAIDDPAGLFNNLGQSSYYFKYRYIYWDNTRSVFSPQSSVGSTRSRGNASIQSAMQDLSLIHI
jgi:hypothetical protein